MFYIEALSLTVILGLFISAFTAYFTSLISKSPNALVDFVKSKVMTTLTFNSTDINFRLVGEWLNDRLKNSKNLQVKDWGGEQHVTIGQGIHRLWYYGPMWVNYKSQKASTSWDPPIESYTLTFLGADQGKVKEFLKDIQKFRKVERNDQVEIFTWRRGGWGYPAFRRPRQLNTVYMPAGQKQYIMDQLKKFIKSEEWYTNRGIPWRVGCLFWGPPGSGKTTLAQALAAHFKRPIYSVNLKGIPNDEALIEALGDVRREGVVLIEDVDAFNIATKRENIDSEKSFEEEQKDAAKLKTNGTPVAIADDDDEEEEEGTPDNKAAAQKSNGITISGLLNAIDGVTATEGRIDR